MNISLTINNIGTNGDKKNVVELCVGRKRCSLDLCDFDEVYSKFFDKQVVRTYSSSNSQDIEGGQVIEALQDKNISKVPFAGIITRLKSRFANGDDIFPENTDKVKIIADEDRFLHLPWEEINNNSLPILKYIRNKKRENNRINIGGIKKILILSSSARDQNGQSVSTNLSEDIKSETDEILGLKNEIHDFNKDRRLEYVYMVRNFNFKSQIKGMPVCDILHIICHGEKDGSICISSADKPNEIHKIASNKFIKLLEPHKFYLAYLSFCHSGSGDKTQNSLAYELVYNGITKYCISFQRSINSTKAVNIAKRFYILLFQKKFDVIMTYQSLFKNSEISQELKDLMPILYY